MRAFLKSFVRRGMLSAWGGPFILAITYWFLLKNNVQTALSMNEAILGILSSILLAFIAGGISVVYEDERLPYPIAVLIQCTVLYLDYLIIYRINGWIAPSSVLLFTGIYLFGFALIWLIVYFSVKHSAKRLNEKLSGEHE